MKMKTPMLLLAAALLLLPVTPRNVCADNSLFSGFTQVEKVYALVDAPSFLNVRERADKKSRIVGILHPGDFCYILYGEGQERVYIESSDLRGFVDGKWLLTGDAIASYGKISAITGAVSEGIVIVAPEDNKAVSYTLTTTQDLPEESAVEEAPADSGETAPVPGAAGEESDEESAPSSENEEPEALPEGGEAGAEAETAESAGTAEPVSTVQVGSSDNYHYALNASSVRQLGATALAGDEAAMEEIIQLLASAAEAEWNRYGYLKSIIIAQAIEETDWLTFPDEGGGLRPADNNVLGMPADFLTGLWTSGWSGTSAIRTLLGEETEVRVYESVDACFMDYAAFMVGIRPELAGELDVETVLLAALGSGGEHTAYTERILALIEEFELTRFDPEPEPEEPEVPHARIDDRTYSAYETELIWAIIAQEDDTSYEGALAVISSVMNRADRNYGGYGTSALDQLTAPGQFCYSPDISPAHVWNWRMGGNVSGFVKAAVSDCLNGGVRNHGYINFRSYDGGGWVRIGTNYYF